MQIIHDIDDFFYTIFPELKDTSDDAIIHVLENYYKYGAIKPKVNIINGQAIVNIDIDTIIELDSDYRKVVALSEKGRYKEAKPILKTLINKNPTNSEFHRIYGQILSDEGDQEEAINTLIDSLRWDSRNSNALLMMGNILAKHKNDLPTALKYFKQVLTLNPKDYISLNSIGGLLLKQGRYDDAKVHFERSINIEPNYPNSHYGLSVIAEIDDDLRQAFDSAIQSIKVNQKKDDIYQHAIRQAFQIANKYILSDIGKKILSEYKHKLEFDGNVGIEIIEDESIQTSAKIELSENYNRNTHAIKYKPSYPAVQHLIMHELVHLDFVIQARKENVNQIFYSTSQQQENFNKIIKPSFFKLQKMGLTEKDISRYSHNLFTGLNSQVYNAPIDLFIENFLFNKFPELKPFQFLSVYAMIQVGLKAVTDKDIIDLIPKEVISKSKIYNLVNALQFKDLYGIDMINDFHPSVSELNQAHDFYNEFLEYREDKEIAEEYELVVHWAEDLKLDKYFILESEIQFNRRKNTDELLTAIEDDPYGFDDNDPERDREMKKFMDSHSKQGTNMAVVMYMVDALLVFKGMKKEKIKEIAYEIAMQGAHGYRPDKEDYRVSAFPNKTFSGFQILAYYYVSFAIAFPELLSQLNLPYDAEYELAKTFDKPKI